MKPVFCLQRPAAKQTKWNCKRLCHGILFTIFPGHLPSKYQTQSDLASTKLLHHVHYLSWVVPCISCGEDGIKKCNQYIIEGCFPLLRISFATYEQWWRKVPNVLLKTAFEKLGGGDETTCLCASFCMLSFVWDEALVRSSLCFVLDFCLFESLHFIFHILSLRTIVPPNGQTRHWWNISEKMPTKY